MDCPHAELELVYGLDALVGRGSSGEVWQATMRETGEAVAVKIVPMRDAMGRRCQRAKKLAMAEVDALIGAEHPNLMGANEVLASDSYTYIVTPFLGGGDLLQAIQRRLYSEGELMGLAEGLCSGLSHLHGRGVMHRDVKAENILLQEGSRTSAVLADFGLATTTKCSTHACGSPLYAAPEVICCLATEEGEEAPASYGQAADMWSVGVLLYVAMSGKPPFSGRESVADLRTLTCGAGASRGGQNAHEGGADPEGGAAGGGRATGGTRAAAAERRDAVRRRVWRASSPASFKHPSFASASGDFLSLVSRLLSVDPAMRPTAAEVLQDPWLALAPGARGRERRPPHVHPATPNREARESRAPRATSPGVPRRRTRANSLGGSSVDSFDGDSPRCFELRAGGAGSGMIGTPPSSSNRRRAAAGGAHAAAFFGEAYEGSEAPEPTYAPRSAPIGAGLGAVAARARSRSQRNLLELRGSPATAADGPRLSTSGLARSASCASLETERPGAPLRPSPPPSRSPMHALPPSPMHMACMVRSASRESFEQLISAGAQQLPPIVTKRRGSGASLGGGNPRPLGSGRSGSGGGAGGSPASSSGGMTPPCSAPEDSAKNHEGVLLGRRSASRSASFRSGSPAAASAPTTPMSTRHDPAARAARKGMMGLIKDPTLARTTLSAEPIGSPLPTRPPAAASEKGSPSPSAASRLGSKLRGLKFSMPRSPVGRGGMGGWASPFKSR